MLETLQTSCALILTSLLNGLPEVVGVEAQPLLAQVARLEEGLRFMGSPLSSADESQLAELRRRPHEPAVVKEVQTLLDRSCIAMVHINPEARVSVQRGPAAAELIQEGWVTALVKVHNEAGVTTPLEVSSPNAGPLYRASSNSPRPAAADDLTEGALANRFLTVQIARDRPLSATLSGLELEYVVLQLHTRDAGKREARLAFHVGHGTADLAFRDSIDVLFDCRPAVKTVLRVRDADGSPTTASFLIEDVDPTTAEAGSSGRGRLYPLPARRLARDDEYPDFFFQPHVYRRDGEHVHLPPGDYDITVRRGPETLPVTRRVTIPTGVAEHELDFEVDRWVHMAELGWHSVDHHVHAAGCSHYDAPAEGVRPEHMWRQGLGEDLSVSCVLSWGPCWYYQKEFFDGRIHALSTDRNILRFDVEVSGFPSSHAGHLCLLRLQEDDFPGASEIDEWPSWTLPVLVWARQQGGVAGYAHSGFGLEPQPATAELPNLAMPRFDGIGANEYIVTVTHDAVDFISAGDTPPVWELNIWYHTLNCGFRTRISGETDFPCLSDTRIGQARSYVRLDGLLDFDQCVEAIRRGRSYVSDGASHVIDFRVGDVELGTGESQVDLDGPQTLTVRARVAAHLNASPGPLPQPDWVSRMVPAQGKAMSPPKWVAFFERRPFWTLEKARIGETRRVPVELIVNGESVARREIEADGSWADVEFELPIDTSSWVAMRVFPSSHTNPIFVIVDGRPIRASEESAAWCRAAVDRCWESKKGAIRAAEREEARRAYDHARERYDRILKEAGAD